MSAAESIKLCAAFFLSVACIVGPAVYIHVDMHRQLALIPAAAAAAGEAERQHRAARSKRLPETKIIEIKKSEV